jgi:hypothetical protein
MKSRNRLVLGLLVMHLSGVWVAGWGSKGHEMIARVAVRALPSDMPGFFRNAEVELGYLSPLPDRWRVRDREPALHGLATRDHTIQLEHVTQTPPSNRYEFLLQYAGFQRPAGGGFAYSEIGFLHYAVAEYSEMLAVSWMLWRLAPESTETERRAKRQLEQSIIHIAGMLSHFVGDAGMPLHTTVHVNGWMAHVPNPNGYGGEGEAIHRRFETVYINNEIEEDDFEDLVEKRARVLGPWLEEAMEHIRGSFEQVETVYAVDLDAPFGSGEETAEARWFAAERLAYSATALRDFWYSAWVKSEQLVTSQ